MLVSVEGHDFLIDAPIRDGIAPYPTSPPDERRRLESAQPPYDRVEAILITHWHEDHFSADAIAAHLSANQRATVISSPEVIDRIRDAAPPIPASAFGRRCPPRPVGDGSRRRRARARAPHPAQSNAAAAGAARRVPHRRDPRRAARRRRRSGGRQLRRVGHDATRRPGAAALLVRVDRDSRQMVATSIAPRRIVAMHLPVAETDTLTAALGNTTLRVALPGLPGHLVELPPLKTRPLRGSPRLTTGQAGWLAQVACEQPAQTGFRAGVG